MGFSVLPVIFLIQLLAIIFAARRAAELNLINRSQRKLIHIGLVLQMVWAAASSILAFGGVFQHPRFLAAWPPFWVTFIAVILVVPWLFANRIKTALRGLIDSVPLHWIVGFQGLRVLAIGSILKALNGEFSRYFAFYVGIPDLIFGISAIVLARLVYRKAVGHRVVIAWNLIGATIIVPIGLVLLQMGLPGPWQIFLDSPKIATIFAFPMVLAPTAVVPIFVMMNLFTAMRLMERRIWASHEKTLAQKVRS